MERFVSIWPINVLNVRNIQLAPWNDDNKIISINKEIRDAIGKTGRDIVTVTLYLNDWITNKI